MKTTHCPPRKVVQTHIDMMAMANGSRVNKETSKKEADELGARILDRLEAIYTRHLSDCVGDKIDLLSKNRIVIDVLTEALAIAKGEIEL